MDELVAHVALKTAISENTAPQVVEAVMGHAKDKRRARLATHINAAVPAIGGLDTGAITSSLHRLLSQK